MLVQNDDILQVGLHGAYAGQDVINVFFFRVLRGDQLFVVADDAILQFVQAFDTNILPNYSAGLVYNEVKAVNLSNPIQIFETNVAAVGGKAGETLPVHDTVSVKLTRSTGITRNGRKAFSAIPEAQQANGDLDMSFYPQAAYDAVLASPTVYVDAADPLNNMDLIPVIVGRTPNASGVSEIDLSRVNVIQSTVINPKVRTQNTRKS